MLQCSFHAAGPGFTAAILIPGIQQIAKDFDVTAQKATYLVAVHVLFLGVAPFLWNPLICSYGRRPVLIASMFLSCVAALGGGFAKTYGTLMTARVFQSIGISSGFVVPGVVVVDLFTAEQRGQKNGVWAQMVSLGAPLGAIIGGPVAQYLGWQWMLWLTAIINGVQALAYLLSFPETSQAHHLLYAESSKSSFSRLFLLPKRLPGQITMRIILEPIFLLRCPHLVLIVLAYAVTFAIISPGISAILPIALADIYDFDAVDQGLFFIGSLVGVILGELLGGRGSDRIMNRERHQAIVPGGNAPIRAIRYEKRIIIALPGYILAIVGVVIFGVTLENHTHWIAPCVGYGIASFGLQLVTTPLKTYCMDCYAARPGSALQLINIIRQVLSFTVPFWSPNLNEALGYGKGFGVEAIMLAFFYIFSLLVLWKGLAWRQMSSIKGTEQ